MSSAPDDRLADVWSAHRRYLVDLAFRMVGSLSEAEDAVQEAFIRLLDTELDELEDVRGWLVVVTGRICLDHMGSARVRHAAGTEVPPDVTTATPDPSDVVTLDDSIRMAMAVVLERLTPPERAAFVLHDVFQFSFDDVASIVGRSAAACRQLASRARRRMQEETGPARFAVEAAEEREVVERFIAACAGGNIEDLLAVLDPDVVGHAELGFLPHVDVEGRDNVAPRVLALFGPQTGTTLVSVPINGEPGILAFRSNRPFALMVLRTKRGLVDHIGSVADPRQLAYLSPLT
ncbi:MAG: sigma-70 family RNA polymerase sigma factor [Acidimicrobiia bacterium]|nr:sigma-70 family RNA polymerase sigma factor [Acidimicrobiia bacterium]